ncbi:hypothetical protein NQ317_004917 [Molorchus minor]|uniref:Ig-like domain-containing protein n=1 Tax=Molorchus minor TaxID=1323400 RepID=A0ABQ9JJ56_9CUCU|nr:hypothetical protein NQ317_004917 [Molorchus minor]
MQTYPGANDLDPLINEGKPPAFVTLGQTYRIATGSTVVLPCRITQPEIDPVFERTILFLLIINTVQQERIAKIIQGQSMMERPRKVLSNPGSILKCTVLSRPKLKYSHQWTT